MALNFGLGSIGSIGGIGGLGAAGGLGGVGGGGLGGLGSIGGGFYFGGGTYVPSVTEIAPPDDRYLPGYSSVDADGNRRYVAPRLKDESRIVQFSLFGLPIPISYGVRRLNGNMIWAAKIVEKVHKGDSGGGKGGGGPTVKETTYTYFGNFAVGFGVAEPIPGGARDVIRVWADGNLIVDRRGTAGRVAVDGVKYKFYPGDELQTADPTIESFEGVGEVPGFRGEMYIVFTDLPLEIFGNRVPTISVEVGDATQLETIKVSMPATGGLQPNANCTLVDFTRFVAYSLDTGNPLLRYDLLNDQFQSSTVLLNGISDAATIIPWLNVIVGAENALFIYQRVIIIDTVTGAEITSIGLTNSVAGADQIEQSLQMVPLLIVTPLMPMTAIIQVSVYNTIAILSYDPIHTSMSVITMDGGLVPQSLIFVRCMCPGEQVFNGAVAYVAGAGTIWKIGVSANPDPTTGGGLAGGVGGLPTENPTGWYVAPEAGYLVDAMIYDPYDKGLVVFLQKPGNPDRIIRKINVDTRVVMWDVHNFTAAVGVSRNYWQSDISQGTLAFPRNGSPPGLTVIDLASGKFDEFDLDSGQFFSGDSISDSSTRSVVGSDAFDTMKREYYDRLTDQRTTLKGFLEFLATCPQVLLDVTDEFEVDPQIDDVIDGGIITDRVRFRSLLETVGAVYRYSIIETGDKIYLTRKAESFSAFDFVVPTTDLMTLVGGGEDPTTFAMRREQDLSLPREVELTYIEKALNYQYVTQFSQRSNFPVATSGAADPLQVRIPIIIRAKEAKILTLKMLYTAWSTRNSHIFRLGPQYIRLEPGDVGSVDAGVATHNVIIVEVSYNADLSQTFKTKAFLSDVPVDFEAGLPDPWPQTIIGFTFTELTPLDVPLIRPQDDSSLFGFGSATVYWVLSGTSKHIWRGGSAQFASPTGSGYGTLGENTASPVIGRLSNVLGTPACVFATDEVNTIDLFTMTDNEDLLSITDAELLEYGNSALVGVDGRWEMIQFRDATQVSPGHWTLSHLLRGRRNTDHNAGNHAVGDTFILLDETWIRAHAVTATLLNQTLLYRGVSFRQNPLEGQVKAIVFDAESAKPVAPCQAEAVWIGPSAKVKWKRRTRGSGEWVDGSGEVPVYENVDYFNIDFYDDVIHSNLIGSRKSDSFTGAGTSKPEEITLSAAEQTAIFGGSIQNQAIYVSIRQIGSIPTVLGRTLDATLTVT